MFRLPEDDPSDVRGCFVVGGHFGFIDKTGALVIPATFFIAQDFSDGLAAVRVEETATSKFGYIDVSGKFAIAPRFGHAAPFSEGLASVEVSARVVGNHVENIAYGFIDKTGQLAIPALYHFAGSFSEGLARVAISFAEGMGFLDPRGNMVIAPGFITAWDFSDGLAVVCSDLCVYIDHQGQEAVPGIRSPWPFVDGLAVSGYHKDSQIYVDKAGHKVAAYAEPSAPPAFILYFTTTVAPACVTPDAPIEIDTGTEFPVVDPAGTTALICRTPNNPPTTGPAYCTVAAAPPIVTDGSGFNCGSGFNVVGMTYPVAGDAVVS
jgi:hypothetical protein